MPRPHMNLLPLGALALLAVACGEPSVAGGPAPGPVMTGSSPEVAPVASAPAQEYVALESQAEIQGRLQDGVIDFHPARPFRAVLLHLASEHHLPLEYAITRPGGSLSQWSRVPLEDPESYEPRGHIHLEEQAIALHLRTPRATTTMTYLGARFFESIPSVGVLDVHYEGQGGDDPFESFALRVFRQQLESGDPYVVPANVLASGASQSVAYEAAPAWQDSYANGNCPVKSMSPGTKKLAQYARSRFGGIQRFEGYACRKSTGNGNTMSQHGTGRAIDFFIPVVERDGVVEANNALGDPVANWLIANAQELGVQSVIWDQMYWQADATPQLSAYTGSSPHVDHLHVEVISETAQQEKEWFEQPNDSDALEGGEEHFHVFVEDENVVCNSSSHHEFFRAGECAQTLVRGIYDEADRDNACSWYLCNEQGSWEPRDAAQCPGKRTAHPQCIAQRPDTVPTTPDMESSCYSRVLAAYVSPGACVQSSYESAGCTKCSWYQCNETAWACVEASACETIQHEVEGCENQPLPPSELPPNSLTIKMEWSEQTDLDMYVREPSQDVLSYSATGTTDGGVATGDTSCKESSCDAPAPYHEEARWTREAGALVTGAYTVWIENYDGRAAASATLTVRRTDADSNLIMDETVQVSVGGGQGARSQEHTFQLD